MRALGKAARTALLGAGLMGVGGFVYSAGYEVRAFRVRHVEIPCLPAHSNPIKVLHISDIPVLLVK